MGSGGVDGWRTFFGSWRYTSRCLSDQMMPEFLLAAEYAKPATCAARCDARLGAGTGARRTWGSGLMGGEVETGRKSRPRRGDAGWASQPSRLMRPMPRAKCGERQTASVTDTERDSACERSNSVRP
mgnify:CR=1 FL=1